MSAASRSTSSSPNVTMPERQAGSRGVTTRTGRPSSPSSSASVRARMCASMAAGPSWLMMRSDAVRPTIPG